MSELFIVLSQPVEQFDSLDEAMTCKRNLERYVPEKSHTIFRCKQWLAGARHFQKMVELMADVQRDGFTEANKDRLRLLLGTITQRTPKLKSLVQVEGPAEFCPVPARDIVSLSKGREI